jgi:hypothetical protein
MNRYQSIVNRFITHGIAGGTILGSLVGSYTFTDPRIGEVRLRDAVFGSIVGGAIGGGLGGLAVLGYPVLCVSPLALGPYAYNKYKMESENRNPVILE